MEIENQEEQRVDPFINLKSEFSRKFDNLAASQQTLVEVVNRLTELSMKNSYSAPEEKETYVSPWEEKEAQNNAKLAEQVAAETERKVMSKINEQQRQQQEIQALMVEFPELQDNNSELAKTSIEIYGRMPENDRKNPIAGKLAIQEAALKLGLLPKSKRNQYVGDEAANLSSTNTGNQRKSTKKVSKDMLAFDNALNVDINDKNYTERLSKFIR